MLHIVLYEPEIPQNTGNIVRLCSCVGASLHLVEPLGFFWDDQHLRRSGLDYWQDVRITLHPTWQHFLDSDPNADRWYFTTKGQKSFHSQIYPPDAYLVFGPETRGLPAELLQSEPGHCVRLPMRQDARSLNLANTVAVATYEALRQNGFPGLT